MKMTAFIKVNRLKLIYKPVDSNPRIAPGSMPADATHWFVRLSRPGASMVTFCSMKPDHPCEHPELEYVLCALRDEVYQAVSYKSFEDFRAAYHYQEEPAKVAYRGCKRTLEQCKRFFGKKLKALMECEV